MSTKSVPGIVVAVLGGVAALGGQPGRTKRWWVWAQRRFVHWKPK